MFSFINVIRINKFFCKSYVILRDKITACSQDTDDDQKMAMLRKAFQMFDTTKSGYIDVLKISTILNTMGQLFDDSELQALIDENDPEGKGNKI